jgi:hypothetical protein
METECGDLSPDMLWRCIRDMGHVGAHENWPGSWLDGEWKVRIGSRVVRTLKRGRTNPGAAR